MANSTVSAMGSHAPGRGAPSVSVSMKPDISRYSTLTPPMTTRLTITVQKAPFLVLRTP